jgi:hypothetical protein
MVGGVRGWPAGHVSVAHPSVSYVPSRSPVKQDRLLASKGSGWTSQPSDTAFGRGFGYVRTRPSNLHPPHTFACAPDDPVHVLSFAVPGGVEHLFAEQWE